MKVKEESEEVGLKFNIQKTKIIASDPITSWQIDGETMETVTYFIFLGSKITADGDCSNEIIPASSVPARAGAGCGSAGDVTGAWLVNSCIQRMRKGSQCSW